MKSKNSKLEQITAEEWATCIKVLQVAGENPAAVPDMETLIRLGTKLYKFARKQRRRLNKQQRRDADRAVRESSPNRLINLSVVTFVNSNIETFIFSTIAFALLALNIIMQSTNSVLISRDELPL
ncbi:MAG: hypothetical protein ABFS56_13980 [Pseudomonadota bacterium]